jgi:hypothetical protein
MTNMNYFEYQYGQASNMPKFNHEKHELCLVPKIPCVSYNEQQLFQASNVPRSLMTNMNIFEHGLRTPNEVINQRYLKNWANVADKICCRHT